MRDLAADPGQLREVRAVLLPDGWHIVAIGSFEPVRALFWDPVTGGSERGSSEFTFLDVSEPASVRMIVPGRSILALKLGPDRERVTGSARRLNSVRR